MEKKKKNALTIQTNVPNLFAIFRFLKSIAKKLAGNVTRIKKGTKANHVFFQILLKIRCNILVSFPSHLKTLPSILRF